MNTPDFPPIRAEPGAGRRPLSREAAREDDRRIREFSANFQAMMLAPMIEKMTSEMGPAAGLLEQTFSEGFAKALAADGKDPLYLQLRTQLNKSAQTEAER